MLIETEGWRLLTDPTFDAPGRRYSFGWGASSRKLAGPAIAASEVGPIDAVLLTHDHHADNLDDAGRALLPSAGPIITTEFFDFGCMRSSLRGYGVVKVKTKSAPLFTARSVRPSQPSTAASPAPATVTRTGLPLSGSAVSGTRRR